ncbi:MAG: metallophosphoesterase [Proteobacteria bacterium]|nr:metallophosphoesterase [Pseudomonadota bacterium]MBU1710296.1 metallophosphoesterase [Pseudomonadota bacterium]
MSLFLLTFLAIYGSAHLYFFIKAKSAFKFGRNRISLLCLFLSVMTAAPIIVRLLERSAHETPALLMAWIGYCWMGFLFLFVSIAVVVDFLRVASKLQEFFTRKKFPAFQLNPALVFFVPLALSSAICIYGFFEARNISMETITIETEKLPSNTSLRIVQISDVHLGLLVGEKRLQQILSAVKAAEPDLLVSTGDLVDGSIIRPVDLAAMFQEIKPRYGKYAVTGNHEYYAGLSKSVSFTESAGFTLLHGNYLSITNTLILAGVDDETSHFITQRPALPEKTFLSGIIPEKFVLFLKHRPEVDPDSAPFFDLQLSGHFHKGQIFPFNLLTWFRYPVRAGHLNRKNGTLLYVSRGSGTWGPPIRFLAPPEVTVINLVGIVSSCSSKRSTSQNQHVTTPVD